MKTAKTKARRIKSKGRKKPEPTFDEVVDNALAEAARKIKRWWYRQQ